VETQTVRPERKPQPPNDQKPEGAEFERFEDLTRKLLEVRKQELDEKRNGKA
jgi:hypothetical protein